MTFDRKHNVVVQHLHYAVIVFRVVVLYCLDSRGLLVLPVQVLNQTFHDRWVLLGVYEGLIYSHAHSFLFAALFDSIDDKRKSYLIQIHF